MTDEKTLARGKRVVHELGLQVIGERSFYFYADDIHRLLGSSVEVTGWYIEKEKRWTSGSTTRPTDSHTALLVNIRPIADKSESDALMLLREFCAKWDDYHKSLDVEWPETIKRAKALLDKETK